MAEKMREEIFEWFGDHELWVGLTRKGDIFSASINKCFARDVCFTVFLYDPASRMLALRPKPGMHSLIVDNYQAIPSRRECEESVWNTDGGVVIYKFLRDEYYDPAPEIMDDSNLQEFVREHPNAIDLLV